MDTEGITNHMERIRRIGIGSAGAVMVALTGAVPAAAQTAIVVPCSASALSAAITTANTSGGGHLLLAPGCTYTLTTPAGSGNGLPRITTPITIQGVGDTITRSLTAVPFRIFDVGVSGDLTLSDLNVSGGDSTANGGGIRNAGTVTLNATTVKGNSADGLGGGISSSGWLNLAGSRVGLNSAEAGGGGINNTGTAHLDTANVDNNSVTAARSQGGGVLTTGGTFVAALSSIDSNAAIGSRANGAGLAAVGGSVHLNGSTVTNNHAATSPGGVLSNGASVSLVLTGVFANSPTNCVGSPDVVPGCAG